MSQTRSFRSRRWRAALVPALVALGCVAAPVASTIAGAPAALATTPTYVLINTAVTVKTSNGESWTLAPEWVQVVAGGEANLVLSLQRTVTSGGKGFEGHVWNFEVTAATFSFSTKTGAGTLNAGSQASPVATVDLSFKSTSSTKASCVSGSETVYSGTLKGEVELVTGLTGGGTVGGKSLTFNLGTPQVKVDSSCVPTPPSSCVSSLGWFSSSSPGTSPAAGGISATVSGTAVDFITVVRKTDLSTPKDAYRQDLGALDGSPGSYDSKTNVLSVSSSSAGIVTGSATLSGGTKKTTTSKCTYDGKSYTLTAVVDSSAKYTSPSGKSLTAHTSLSGNLVAPNSTTAGFEVVTRS